MTEHRPLNATSPPHNDGSHSATSSPDSRLVRELPGADDLIAAGFEPLEELTGVTWIGAQWPTAHRRALPEVRADYLEAGEDVVWFVRSPWPSMTVTEVISLVWSQLPRDDESSWPATIRDVLSWPEDRAQGR